MTQEEILEYNRRCAEFLGYERIFTNIWGYDSYWEGKDKNKAPVLGMILGNDELLKFHSDWNWIMKVVEAIEKIYDDFHGYFGVYINSNSCTIQGTNLRTDPDNYHPAYFSEHLGEDKKEAVVQAINQFLIWYNINKKNLNL